MSDIDPAILEMLDAIGLDSIEPTPAPTPTPEARITRLAMILDGLDDAEQPIGKQ